MLKLGLLFLLVRFLILSVLPSKAVFIYIVRSPRFIPSPYFIPSPQSVVRSPQSAVLVLYWPVSFIRLALSLSIKFGAQSSCVIISVLIEPLNGVERHKTFHRWSLFFRVLSRIVHAYANVLRACDSQSSTLTVQWLIYDCFNKFVLLWKELKEDFSVPWVFYHRMVYHHNFLTILA